MINFGVYQSTTLEDLGTVAMIAGKKGKLRFIPKNLRDLTKRVAVVVTKANGESAVITCSNNISELVRTAIAKGMEDKKALAVISKLSVLEGENAVPFISAPAGSSAAEEFTIEQLATEKVTDYEALVAF